MKNVIPQTTEQHNSFLTQATSSFDKSVENVTTLVSDSYYTNQSNATKSNKLFIGVGHIFFNFPFAMSFRKTIMLRDLMNSGLCSTLLFREQNYSTIRISEVSSLIRKDGNGFIKCSIVVLRFVNTYQSWMTLASMIRYFLLHVSEHLMRFAHISNSSLKWFLNFKSMRLPSGWYVLNRAL